jgi:hypothetical protein
MESARAWRVAQSAMYMARRALPAIVIFRALRRKTSARTSEPSVMPLKTGSRMKSQSSE